MRFTRTNVAALKLAPNREYQIFWDDGLPGFGLRVNASNKVWVVQYRANGKSRRETIGRLDAVQLEAARDHARKILARVQLGADPHAERVEAEKRRSVLFSQVAQRYLQAAESRLKPRSLDEVTRHLRKHWAPLGEMPIRDIARPTIAHRLEEISEQSGPIAANRARATLSALFSYALGMGLADLNPVVGTLKAGDERQRDRVLSDSELAAIWKECGTADYGRIIRLLVLTGQRREEVGGMQWSELDLAEAIWTIPAARTKNGRTHEVPLSRQAVSILKETPRILGRDLIFGLGVGGFSGWSKSKLRLDQRLASLNVSPWRLHDLRRTAATGMATLGVQPHVVEAVLNHVSGSKAGIAGIYNRASYRVEKCAALKLWDDRIFHLTRP